MRLAILASLLALAAADTTFKWAPVLTSSGSSPTQREGHRFISINDSYGVLFGGQEDKYTVADDLYKFDPATGAWSQPSASGPPTARYWHGMTAVGQNSDQVYLFGGMAQDYTPLSDLYTLDTTAPSWAWKAIPTPAPGASSPSARWGHSVTRVAADLFILFGGYNGSTQPTDCLWVFNSTSKLWTKSTIVGTPPRSRAWHTANWIPSEQTLVIFGGQDSDFQRHNDVIFVKDAANGSWTSVTTATPYIDPALTTLPQARSEHSSVEHFNDVLIYGGLSNTGPFPYKDRVYLSDAYLFSISTLKFTPLSLTLTTPIPSGLYDPVSSGSMSHGCSRIGTQLYITYGMDQYMMQLNGVVKVDLGNLACPPGEKYVNATAGCERCPPGTYQGVKGGTECVKTDPGYFAATFSSWKATMCPAGTYADGTMTTCHPCPAESSSTPGSSTCTPCNPGFTTYNLTGAATCQPKELTYTLFIPTVGLREAVLAIAIIFIVVSLATAMFIAVYGEQRVIVSASRRLLYMIIFGSVLSYLSIVTMFTQTNAGCLATAWLTNMGFSFMIGGLIFKTWRIASIFNSQGNRKAMKDADLLKRLAAFITLYLIYHIAWSIHDRPKLYLFNHQIIDAQVTQAYKCTAGPWSTGMLIIELVCLIVGVYVTVKVRNVPSAFNESRYIALALYNWLFIGVILQVILMVTNPSPDAAFVIQALSVILTAGGAILLLFVPKAVLVISGKGNNVSSNTMPTSTSHGSNETSSIQRKTVGVPIGGPSVKATVQASEADLGVPKNLKAVQETVERQKAEIAALQRRLEGKVANDV
ncbi:hypothetical protein HK104_001593 [Borealophlyctis nickersoniae]|nr:hypothetical protein HK104_001593 [Borealophlyctis nickersoniae]